MHSSSTRDLSGMDCAMPYTAARPVRSASGSSRILNIFCQRIKYFPALWPHRGDGLGQVPHEAGYDAIPEEVGDDVELHRVGVLQAREHPAVALRRETRVTC